MSILLDFPKLPSSKVYSSKMTPEQEVLHKLIQQQKITKAEEQILEEAIAFYERAFAYLININLSLVTEEQVEEIKAYLDSIINTNIIFQNGITLDKVVRITPANNEFLENNKVRNANYIKYPPLEIIEEGGIYGRANMPNSTCFYCAMNTYVALFETRPKPGQRILISVWENQTKKKFTSFPVSSGEVVNEGANKSKNKFDERMGYNHPLLAKIFSLQMNFWNSAFTKKFEMKSLKNFEWLYSAYFAGRILIQNVEPVEHEYEPIYPYDCIVFPSVADLHRTDNLAIKPTSVDENLVPVYIEDCLVLSTNYKNYTPNESSLPIVKLPYRVSKLVKDNRIIWDDD